METLKFVFLFFFITVTAGYSDKIITDSNLGYSIYLPQDSWVRVVASATHHQFYDTSNVYRSHISIVRHAYSPIVYPVSTDWTRATFIAYKLLVEYSVDPFGAIVYYDSSSTVRQSSNWATESYATFFTLDTAIGAWSEYTRFTAAESWGWELYAIGDTADMTRNIGTYAGIIQLINLNKTATTTAGQVRPINTQPKICNDRDVLYDPLGRKMGMVTIRHAEGANGFYLSKGQNRPRPIIHKK